jgi:uncharacterized membrane protein HdeD (DUF308 family)
MRNKTRKKATVKEDLDIFFRIPWWAYLGFAFAWYCGIDILTEGINDPVQNGKSVSFLFNSSTKITWSIIQLFMPFLSLYFGIIAAYYKQWDPKHSKDLVFLILVIFLLVTAVITIDEGAENSFNKRIKEKFSTTVVTTDIRLK